MKIEEEQVAIMVHLEMSPSEATDLTTALYRMQAYQLNNGNGIPASRRDEYPDLKPLFELYDLLYSKGYEG